MARRLAAEIPGAFFPDQHNDRANNEAHYRSTGPEIWRQMEGRIDWFVAGIGTGGTVSGVARYLKEQDPNVKVMAVDIAGSVFTDHFKCGRRVEPHRTLVEGLGDEEIIGCPEWERIDDMVQASDRDAILAARELARTRGDLRRRLLRRDALGRAPAGRAPRRVRKPGPHRDPVRRLRQPLPFDDLQRRLDRQTGLGVTWWSPRWCPRDGSGDSERGRARVPGPTAASALHRSSARSAPGRRSCARSR